MASGSLLPTLKRLRHVVFISRPQPRLLSVMGTGMYEVTFSTQMS